MLQCSLGYCQSLFNSSELQKIGWEQGIEQRIGDLLLWVAQSLKGWNPFFSMQPLCYFHPVPNCVCHVAKEQSCLHLCALLSELNITELNVEEKAIWKKFLWGLFSESALLSKAVANPKQSLRQWALAALLVLIRLTYCLSPWKGARYTETLV